MQGGFKPLLGIKAVGPSQKPAAPATINTSMTTAALQTAAVARVAALGRILRWVLGGGDFAIAQ